MGQVHTPQLTRWPRTGDFPLLEAYWRAYESGDAVVMRAELGIAPAPVVPEESVSRAHEEEGQA